MKRIFISIFLLIMVFSFQDLARATLYVGDQNGGLYALNKSGTTTFIGNMGKVMTDVAISPNGGLYAISFTSLYSVNPVTAASSLIGSLGFGQTNGLAFDTFGTLYASAGNNLLTVNTISGVGTIVGNMGYASSGDIAFDSFGNLYLAAYGSPYDALVRISPTTGAGTFIGSINYDKVYGLGFYGGILYGTTQDKELISINTNNGIGSFMANTGIAVWGASPIVNPGVVPEPSTLLLLGVGIAGIAGHGIRRKKKA